ncbi:zinc finger protein 43-like [Tigriopus californicus]|uniref:zinc finger protein 43-like n=1 Tax=Tigriopus californicus TaxID=6832 RepID=UPI0027D9F638|nr:zinc finger protein 43-like [Tigriopus californicus]
MGAKTGWQCHLCAQGFGTAQAMHAHYTQSYDPRRLAQALTELSRQSSAGPGQGPHPPYAGERLEIVLTELQDEATPTSEKLDLLQEEEETPLMVLTPPKKGGRPKKFATGTKFQCPQCQKTFSCNGNLTKHMVLHAVDKPFKCDICPMQFNQARDLRAHRMQNHSSERPHTCQVCGKGFVHKFYLEEHTSYHTGERRFQCGICGKQFQSNSVLNKHQSRHNEKKDHKCHQCSKAFTVIADLRAHVKFVHEKLDHEPAIPVFQPKSGLSRHDVPENYEYIIPDPVLPEPPDALELDPAGYPVYVKPKPVLRMVKSESRRASKRMNTRSDTKKNPELLDVDVTSAVHLTGEILPEPILPNVPSSTSTSTSTSSSLMMSEGLGPTMGPEMSQSSDEQERMRLLREFEIQQQIEDWMVSQGVILGGPGLHPDGLNIPKLSDMMVNPEPVSTGSSVGSELVVPQFSSTNPTPAGVTNVNQMLLHPTSHVGINLPTRPDTDAILDYVSSSHK